MELGFILILKAIEVLKHQTPETNTCLKSTVEALEEGVTCPKVNNKDSRAMTSFCLGIDRVT